jgi:hypothetical protein
MQTYKEPPVIEIIKQDRTCQNGEAERVLPIIEERLSEGNSLLVRKYNSLLFVTKLAVGEAETHFYSVDDALRAVRAVKYFINQMRDSGINTIYIQGFTDENMKRILEMIKLTINPSDKNPFEYMVNLRGSK